MLEFFSNDNYNIPKFFELKKDWLFGYMTYDLRNEIEVLKTHGSNLKLKKYINFNNFTKIDDGLLNLTIWAKKYLKKIK